MSPNGNRRPVEDGSGGEKAGRPGIKVAPADDTITYRRRVSRRLDLITGPRPDRACCWDAENQICDYHREMAVAR